MIEILLLITFTVLDAYKDGLAGRGHAPWWEWHIAKWVVFFGSQGYIVTRYLSDNYWSSMAIVEIIILAGFCLWLWRTVYAIVLDINSKELP
jgi:hypothetical protein